MTTRRTASSPERAQTSSLTMALVAGPWTSALLRGRVPLTAVDGTKIEVRQARSVDVSSRSMLSLEFDVAEMSFSTLLGARVSAGLDLVALPIFTGRRFPHGAMYGARESRLDDPSDLAGRRVAVPQYWMTSSVWHRGILRDQYGVAAETIDWVTTRPERLRSLPTDGFEHIEGTDPAALLSAGQVDAVLLPKENAVLAESSRPLVPDVAAAQRAYADTSRVFPIMHLVVMRGDVLRARPDAPSLVASLIAQSRILGRQDSASQSPSTAKPSTTGSEPLNGDLASSMPTIRTFLRYARDQGLTDRLVDPDEFLVNPAS